jgi:tetratricopeptide (TPR) repeat protein
VKPEDRDRLLALFQLAAEVPPATSGHVTDDDDLLTTWRQGELTPAEEDRFFAHLDACPACRKRIAELGQLTPEPDAALVTIPSAVAKPSRPRRLLLTAIVAVAACLVIGLAWVLSPARESARLDQARRDLNDGRPEDAWGRIERLSGERAGQLQEEAAYKAGLADLQGGRYDETLDWCRKADEKGVRSGRLENLRLMASADPAERVPAEVALEFRGNLLARGFRPDGTRANATSPQPDPVRQAAWEAAVKAYPESPVLVHNYGEFLLSRGRYRDALAVFLTPISQWHHRDPSAGIGMGLARFADGRDPTEVEAALSLFRATAEENPNHPALLIDVAVCLERLGKPAEAQTYWENALPLVSDPAIQEQIRRHLDRK